MATAGDRRGSGPERAFAELLPEHGEVVLDAAESSHLVRSRRVGPGDVVVLFDGRGGTVAARLVDADPRAARLEVSGAYPDREPGRQVVLAVSPPEGGRCDALVAAAAELGVTLFVPIACDRTPPRRVEQAVRRRGRWARLAQEAAKVSGRSRLLDVAAPVTLGALLASPIEGPTFILDPDPEMPALDARDASAVRLVVGPEGGFTDAEVERAHASGAVGARIGATALRTETAAIAACAVVLA